MAQLPAATFRRYRVGLGLSQAALGRVLGVTALAVSRWERGDRKVPGPAATAVRLLAYLQRTGTPIAAALETPAPQRHQKGRARP